MTFCVRVRWWGEGRRCYVICVNKKMAILVIVMLFFGDHFLQFHTTLGKPTFDGQLNLKGLLWNNNKNKYLIKMRSSVNERSRFSSEGCGLSARNRIVNGRSATNGAYPFAALLYRRSLPFGGAAIVDRQWILTAAHNFHTNRSLKASDYKIGVGSSELNQLRIYKVDKIFIHPNYRRMQKFDIALIKLQTPLQYGPTVRPVCLPKSAFEPINAKQARVVGWGYKQFNRKQVSPELQEVDLDIISLEQCKKIYETIHQEIVRSQICTWSPDRDACAGDSGGPLFVFVHGRAVLYGLVSFGVTCADQFPGVYTAVSYYLSWIDKIIQNN